MTKRLARLGTNGYYVHEWTVGYNGGWAAISNCGAVVDQAKLYVDKVVKVATCAACMINR